MTKVRFAPSANVDLMRITEHIAEDNPIAALDFVNRLRAACQAKARFPAIGKREPDLPADMYWFPFTRYVIYYKFSTDRGRLDILRVIHSARDHHAVIRGTVPSVRDDD
ncbi:type II toxin-antitoxin system RelE/ParE family toxin [Niveispirillum sp. KHB5.9]|uniref:type II toxin-antitoxin system RelE/ParE family toxin n=1 Tax=Niveispirillum sp. KHB5.9 TaxID=3400269 RepID=UPI003A8ADB74